MSIRGRDVEELLRGKIHPLVVDTLKQMAEDNSTKTQQMQKLANRQDMLKDAIEDIMKFLVVMPTYNEKENISRIIPILSWILKR